MFGGPDRSRSARILRLAEVCRRTGLSRTTIWRLVKRGEFPRPRHLTKSAVGWLERELNDWVESRPAADIES